MTRNTSGMWLEICLFMSATFHSFSAFATATSSATGIYSISDEPAMVRADETDQASTDVRERLPTTWNWTYDSQGPVCGVYAVCRALSQLGMEVLPNDLWNSNVVGQSQGSTPRELMQAIREFGFHADLRQHLNLLDLQAAGLPVVVNVRSAPDRSTYDHWVCVQAAEQGLFLFDGSAPGRLIDTAEFLASFSGIGIVVGPNRAGRFRIDAAKSVSIIALLAIGLFALSVHATQNSAPASQLVRIGIATGAMLTSSLILFGTANGLSNGAKMAVEPYRGVEFRHGTVSDMVAAINSRNTLLVDARIPASVAYGTLKRAVNIPVFANYFEIRDFTRELNRETPVVVFCQSQRCGYDEHIAGALARLGFTNVTTSREGYAEWIQLHSLTTSRVDGIQLENRATTKQTATETTGR